ncbi:hypothetical protein EDC04DRAFT_2614051 [Pisolithus marmoratus]|nr:hypothetical protein EDC04DRAFT_2614051 [Pisolithus marmoratus]
MMQVAQSLLGFFLTYGMRATKQHIDNVPVDLAWKFVSDDGEVVQYCCNLILMGRHPPEEPGSTSQSLAGSWKRCALASVHGLPIWESEEEVNTWSLVQRRRLLLTLLQGQISIVAPMACSKTKFSAPNYNQHPYGLLHSEEGVNVNASLRWPLLALLQSVMLMADNPSCREPNMSKNA